MKSTVIIPATGSPELRQSLKSALIQKDRMHASTFNHYVATLAVTNRSSSRNLLFNDAGHLVGWKNNTTGEEKWVNSNASSQPYSAKAFSGIQIIALHTVASCFRR